MINYPLQWSPQFSQHPLAELGWLFIGTDTEHYLPTAEFKQLQSWVEQGYQLADAVLSHGDTTAQVRQLTRIEQLVSLGMLTNPSATPPAGYQCPDFSQAASVHSLDGVVLHTFSVRSASTDALNTFVCTLKLAHGTHIVLIDDPLDPRIPALAQQFQSSGADWLLFKVSGKTLELGPLWRAGHSGACFACLRHRRIQNSPVREWLRRHQQSERHAPVPISLASPTPAALGALATAFHADAESGSSYLLEIDAQASNTAAVVRHPLTRRPQCPHCGSARAVRADHPQALAPNPKHANQDGGYRTAERAATLQAIGPQISALTGVISDLRKISVATDEQTLSIYRAAYFQNSYQHQVPSADTFVQLALGKGVTDQQAQASALGEALERLAAQYQGDEAIVQGTQATLTARAVSPSQLTPYSPAQYQSFAQHTGVSLQFPQWVKAYSASEPLHWIAGYSLTHAEPVYFPAAYCLANTPFDDQVYSLYNHNGNAAGNTREEAILQGTLELIERDACAIWWYNQIPRPAMNLAMISEQHLATIDRTLAPDWDYWVLDITNNIAVPCCAAVAQNKHSGQFVLGFGCHLDPAIACQRALTEMFQLIVIKDEVTGPFDFSAIPAHPFLYPKRNTAPRDASDYPLINNADLRDDVLYLLELLKQHQLELCVVDYSRADLPLKTLKVLVPGLCHFWPQLANPRLYNVPVTCGWLSRPLSETQLNPMALYL